MAKITQDVAIERIRAAIGDEYDLSKAVYVDSKTKMTVVCAKHGEFEKTPQGLWGGSGCEPCRQDKKVLPVEDWIARFRSVHGDRYDYSLITDLRHPKMAVIICREHGDFQKQPHNHWTGGAGCPVCSKATLTPQSNRYSREQWIKRFKEAHGDRYGYEKFELMGARGAATFFCPEHGEFKQTQDDHAKGRVGCAPCRKNDAAAKFFADAKVRFGDRYGYDKFEYANAKTKSAITCPEHGEFMQNPDKHLTSKYPCPACSNAVKSERMKGLTPPEKPRISAEEYLRRLALPERYTVDMSGYVGLTEGVVVLSCPTHGDSSYGPQNLLITKHKCNGCARVGMRQTMTKSYEDFVTEATTIHKDAYVYPDCPDYVNRKSIVTVICASHGAFEKKAQKHLIGQGCPKCTMDELRISGRLTGGYSMDIFDANETLGKKSGTVYYVKVGSLYKIGITSLDVRRRMTAIKSTSKRNVELIQSHECSLRDAYIMEQSVLKRFEAFRTFRRWSTELFTEDVLNGLQITDIPLVPKEDMDDWGYTASDDHAENVDVLA